jgi:hypothetical protein
VWAVVVAEVDSLPVHLVLCLSLCVCVSLRVWVCVWVCLSLSLAAALRDGEVSKVHKHHRAVQQRHALRKYDLVCVFVCVCVCVCVCEREKMFIKETHT